VAGTVIFFNARKLEIWDKIEKYKLKILSIKNNYEI